VSIGETNNKGPKKEPSMVDEAPTVSIGETNNNGPKKEPSMVDEAAPYVIVVHGPPKVGKSLLIDSLIKYYTSSNHYTSKNHANGDTLIMGS
ncbi:hypothetical protein MKW98_000175, partial [Papaver atlanticum]